MSELHQRDMLDRMRLAERKCSNPTHSLGFLLQFNVLSPKSAAPINRDPIKDSAADPFASRLNNKYTHFLLTFYKIIFLIYIFDF